MSNSTPASRPAGAGGSGRLAQFKVKSLNIEYGFIEPTLYRKIIEHTESKKHLTMYLDKF